MMNSLFANVEIRAPPEIPAAIAAGGQDRGRRDILRDLIIGEKAEVKGIVKTRSAVVLGRVEGDSAVQTESHRERDRQHQRRDTFDRRECDLQ